MLYQALAFNLETFLARQQQEGRCVPSFVERELRDFLECGVLARGFLRLHCDTCGADKLVPFSCKHGRSFCPACCGRRMVDTAAHLVDHVIPRVPVRQWVLSLPYALRYRLAYDPEMVTAVYQVFMRALFGHLRRRARLLGVEKGHCGAVTFVQRFGGSLNVNVHFHVVCLDGVYSVPETPNSGAGPQFHVLDPPTDAEVRQLVEAVARRVAALLKRKGMDGGSDNGEESDALRREEPWLSGVVAASISGRVATGARAGKRVQRGGDRVDPESIDPASSPRCAGSEGFSLHGNVAVPAGDRQRLERLVRYMARPPLCSDRLDGLPDGRLVYVFKRPWRDGTDRLVFEPSELLERLAALISKPRCHLIRFSGLLAPAARWRSAVVPSIDTASENEPVAPAAENAAPGQQSATSEEKPASPRRRRNYLWSELLKRVFSVDVLACECGGKLRLAAAIHPPENTRKILDCMGLPSRPPPIAPARSDGPLFDFS